MVVNVIDGNTYIGYGDWNNNTGPVDLIWFDANGVKHNAGSVPTEAIWRFNKIDGKVAGLWIDPKPSYGGWTYADGTQYLLQPHAYHIFDAFQASDGSVYAAGSAKLPSGSNAGVIWKNGQIVFYPEERYLGRMYWVREVRGKLYAYYRGSDGYSGPADYAIYTSRDGERWREAKFYPFCTSHRAPLFENDGKLHCNGYVYDGSKYQSVGSASSSFLGDDGVSYFAGRNGDLVSYDSRLRTTTVLKTDESGIIPVGVGNGYVYGVPSDNPDKKIFRAKLP